MEAIRKFIQIYFYQYLSIKKDFVNILTKIWHKVE